MPAGNTPQRHTGEDHAPPLARRQLRLGVILDGAGATADGWRRPGVRPDASVHIDSFIAQAQRAEAALLDFIFIPDTLYITPQSAPHLLNRLEPISMLSAVATHTRHIGLAATMSVLFADPFTVARQIASLDLISNGRAAWNIVTSAVAPAALNHSLPADFGTTDRYQRAAEHVAVCQGLWDSWEPDAFTYNKTSGQFFDKDKLHPLHHTGKYYSVAGPLTIQTSRQGHPVLFQAGGSSQGRDLAAQFADGIFAMVPNMDDALDYISEVRARAATYGRSPDAITFFPRISPLVAETESEVTELYLALTRLNDIDDAIHVLGQYLPGHDFTRYPLDAPFPAITLAPPDPAAAKPDRLSYIETVPPEDFVARVRREGLSLREAAQQFMTPRTGFMGTPAQVADTIAQWLDTGAADGFIIRGGDFEAFAHLCIPVLQQRGLFRTAYEADTLRENLGLPPSRNRYAKARAVAAQSLATA